MRRTALGEVISQSFGATEETFPNKATLLSLRSAFENAAANNVTVLGASGDEGVANVNLQEEFHPHKANSRPSADPLVTSVGGTQLHLNEAGERTAPDRVWNDIPVGIDAAGGGGPSKDFELPLTKGYEAKKAYDMASGLGTVNGYTFAHALAGH